MAITDRTRKVLWGRSGNRCALCRCELVMESSIEGDLEAVVGDECHIIGQKPDAARGDLGLGLQDLDDYENLILLCKTHHKLVDDQPEKFGADFLCNLRAVHENWVKACLEPHKQRGKSPQVFLLSRIITGKDLMGVLGGVCFHLLTHDEPENEEELESLSRFAQEVQDWIDVWNEIESGERVRAGFGLSQRIRDLEHLGFCVFALPAKQTVKFDKRDEFWSSGILAIVRNSNAGITELGQLACLVDNKTVAW